MKKTLLVFLFLQISIETLAMNAPEQENFFVALGFVPRGPTPTRAHDLANSRKIFSFTNKNNKTTLGQDAVEIAQLLIDAQKEILAHTHDLKFKITKIQKILGDNSIYFRIDAQRPKNNESISKNFTLHIVKLINFSDGLASGAKFNIALEQR